MSKISKLASAIGAGLIVVSSLLAVSPANAWAPFSAQIPMQFSPTPPTVSPTDTKVPYDFDIAFSPFRANNTPLGLSTAIDIEFNFFYTSFVGGYGACTAATVPGSYDCPGGVSVLLTQPDGDPYTVTSVILADQSAHAFSLYTGSGAPFDATAARVIVALTSPTAADFAGVVANVHFPADNINLASAIDNAKVPNPTEESALYFAAGAWKHEISNVSTGFTAFHGSWILKSNSTPTDSSSGSLAATGDQSLRLLLLAGGLISIGAGSRLAGKALSRKR
jgi:hypothetical protein